MRIGSLTHLFFDAGFSCKWVRTLTSRWEGVVNTTNTTGATHFWMWLLLNMHLNWHLITAENRSRQEQQLQIQTCRSSLWHPAAYSIVGAWARIMPLFWAGLCHHPGMRRIMGLSGPGLFHYRPPYCVWRLSWLMASKCRSQDKNTRQHFIF